MKKLALTLFAFIFLAVPCFGADLQWDYPTDWDGVTGWTVYFTDGTDNFNKSIGKADVTEDGTYITYTNIDSQLNLHPSVGYTIYITAYNDDGESGPSNSIMYTLDGYSPPLDVLPTPSTGSPQSPTGLTVI